jgi:hypothetical protein
LIENHKLILANFILEKLNTVKIPDIVVKTGNDTNPGIQFNMTENWYNLDYATEDMVTLKTDTTNNSIYFVIEPLMCKFTSSNLVIADGPIKTSGELEADIWRS